MRGDLALARFRSLQFVVLCRAFFTQLFASESVAAETHLRHVIVGVLAFLVTPGMFLVVQLMPSYRVAVLRAATFGTPEIVDRLLTAMGSVFVMFSMITIGLVTAFIWDALSFDRRDAMVLGPLPIRGAAVVAAKVAALGAFLLGASAGVSLMTAVPFALVTADRAGGPGPLGHLMAHLSATIGSAVFVFATIVSLRGLIAFLGPRAAAAAGSFLQFVFVSGLLSVIVLVPALTPARMRLIEQQQMQWVPPAWFLGLYERQLQLERAPFAHLADAVLPAVLIVVVVGAAVSVLGYRRQMRLALVPSASTGAIGAASVSRWLARALVGRNAVSAATADFILLTLARSRTQRAPIAMNAALGVAVIAAALSRYVVDLESLMRPRTVVLWVPLVLAYWAVIGLRASFFVPSELPAAWVFRAITPEPATAPWSGTRAAMLGFVAPRMLLVVGLLIPLVGWQTAAWHAFYAGVLLLLLVEVLALTITHIPFTREYRPGHAKLRSRWPLYLFGMFAFAYWPVQLELRLLDAPVAMLAAIGSIAMAALTVDLIGRRRAGRWPIAAPEEEDEDAPTVLFAHAELFNSPNRLV